MNKIKIHLKNIYLIVALIIIGILLRINRKYLFIDFHGRWIINHLVTFFFIPIFLVTLLFLIDDWRIKKGKHLKNFKYWVVVIALCINIFLIFFWEINVQHFQTWYQMIIYFIATGISFFYLFWYYSDKYTN